MNYINLILLIFLLSAFSVGSAFNRSGIDIENATIALDVANISDNINLHAEYQNNTYTRGLMKVLEYYAKFIVIGGVEIFKLGIYFGSENPQYFEASFIIALLRFILWLVVISLLIRPLTYLIVLIALGAIWFSEKVKKKRHTKSETN